MVKVTMDQIIAFRNSGDIFGGMTLPLKGAYQLKKKANSTLKNSKKL